MPVHGKNIQLSEGMKKLTGTFSQPPPLFVGEVRLLRLEHVGKATRNVLGQSFVNVAFRLQKYEEKGRKCSPRIRQWVLPYSHACSHAQDESR
jgi:hypothetical protein